MFKQKRWKPAAVAGPPLVGRLRRAKEFRITNSVQALGDGFRPSTHPTSHGHKWHSVGRVKTGETV